jgi:hypothetical protein
VAGQGLNARIENHYCSKHYASLNKWLILDGSPPHKITISLMIDASTFVAKNNLGFYGL